MLLDYYGQLTPFQAALSLCLLVLFILYLFLKDIGLPPGPVGLPLFGYWPFLKEDKCYLQLRKLAEKYGDVFSFKSAGKLYIHLGSTKVIKEAHVTKSDCFEGRFTGYSLFGEIFGDGVGFVNGESWKVQRKFFLQKFKEYGMNATKENLTGFFQDILEDTIEELRSMKGQPVKITDLATVKCTLIIRRMLFNDNCITDADIKELMDEYTVFSGAMQNTTFFLIGNIAKYLILPFIPSTRVLKRSYHHIKEIFYEIVRKQKSVYDEDNVTNIIDCFFKERDERCCRGDPTAKHFTDKSLVSSLLQFVTDGTSTIGLFIGTFLMCLAEYPEEQEKLYEEIIEVIGSDRLPSMDDKTMLPYTNAFIYEVMRTTDLFVLFPSLQCSKETTLNGYRIPEGAITVVNLSCAHRNPLIYDDPESFNPSRYLTEPGKPKPDLPIVFGVGKRSCIGEGFTMIQTFLFLTTVVQNFRICYPEGSQGVTEMFFSKEKLEICAIPRSSKI